MLYVAHAFSRGSRSYYRAMRATAFGMMALGLVEMAPGGIGKSWDPGMGKGMGPGQGLDKGKGKDMDPGKGLDKGKGMDPGRGLDNQGKGMYIDKGQRFVFCCVRF